MKSYFSAIAWSNFRERISYRTSFARLSLLTFASLFVLMISGSFVSGSDAAIACANWPLCSTSPLPVDALGWIGLIHRLLVVLVGGLFTVLLVKAWRTQHHQTTILVSTTSAFVLYIAQSLLGAKLVQGFPVGLQILHQVTAAATWLLIVIQVVAAGQWSDNHSEKLHRTEFVPSKKGFLIDLLALTKPVVVLLLLVTTYAGMVISTGAWPSLSITFWTLLGGFFAAGGSSAINQYIDRQEDARMQRTQRRPIPSGRLTPGEGLAFGIGMALASFYIMVAFVNLTAAMLSVAGIIYYVLIYSVLLKKTTVQNIVIGGGAGAIPPLVGWAAATGGLSFPSLLLFVLVFLWTPPHFWALALVRRKDYARAGVPMLPVVRGEKTTRWQILLYTIGLVIFTLLLPLLGLGGWIYLTGAFSLGLWLFNSARKVWKVGGNKLAWKMYRYSSMYLAFLFAVLMVDRLI